MIARWPTSLGVEHLGIGSDLCQDQPDSVVEWMRVGRWSKEIDYGEGSAGAGLPAHARLVPRQPRFRQYRKGLRTVGMSSDEVAGSWAATGIVSSRRISAGAT
jgi:membrane dipeptidase